MPVVSKSQRRFMGMVASGSLKKRGLSKAKAGEFLHATPKGAKLPERVKKKGSRGMSQGEIDRAGSWRRQGG